MQGFLPVTNQTNMKDLHNGIICGAAQFINEIELFDDDFQWAEDVTKKSFLLIAVEAVERLEIEYSCYNETNESNEVLIHNKQKAFLRQEEIIGTNQITLL